MCRLTIVEENNIGSNEVFLSIKEQENNCSCSVSVKNLKNFANLYIKRLNTITEQPFCGMEIDIYFMRPNETLPPKNFPFKCNSTDHAQNVSLGQNEYLQFTSRVVDGTFESGYCIKIDTGS